MTDKALRKEKEMMDKNKVPVLRTGDVIKDKLGRWILVMTPHEGYQLNPETSRIEFHAFLSHSIPVVIYRDPDSGVFAAHDLQRIIQGKAQNQYLYWKEAAVKEMTVDQISKELGYTVKVIGNE
jgi:hypothetical protein